MSYLSEEETKWGYILGLDYWAETGCSVKYAYVNELFEGKSANETGFTSTLGSINNLPIAHVLYVFDKEDGNVVLI